MHALATQNISFSGPFLTSRGKSVFLAEGVPGTVPDFPVQLRLQVGLRQMQATAMVRDYRAQDMSFEIVDMNLEERSKYRRRLAGHLSHTAAARDLAAVK